MRKVDWSKSKLDTSNNKYHGLHRLWMIGNDGNGYPADVRHCDVELIKLQERMVEKYKISDEDFDAIVDAAKECNERSHDYDGDGD